MDDTGKIYVGEIEYWSALGNVTRLQAALQKGHDVNATSRGSYTALHVAAENGHLEIVRILLAASANPNAKLDTGETPRDLAMQGGHSEIAELLPTTS